MYLAGQRVDDTWPAMREHTNVPILKPFQVDVDSLTLLKGL